MIPIDVQAVAADLGTDADTVYGDDGDQAGEVSRLGSVVNRTGSPGPTSLTYISKLSSFAPFQEKATWFPSGERLGSD